MTKRNVTITSKNQITLPSEYVKYLNLAQSRVLRAEVQEGKIVLTPEPLLNEVMMSFWGKHSAKQGLTDAEIKQATREAAVKRLSRG